MAGTIFFSNDEGWDYSSRAIFHAFEIMIDELPEGSQRRELQELVDNNIPFLDLSAPNKSELVRLIVDKLPQHIERNRTKMGDGRANALYELVGLAAQQLEHNAGSSSA